jgi:hypothetical protein
MLHINKIKDADPYFVVEPITRAIKNVSSSKTTLIQHDHNSEQFTFELPRYIEGHDMMECNLVEIHYINESTKGRYIVNDLTVIEDDENRLKFTWLLTNNASSNVGALRFGVRFACLDDDGEIEYVWNTAPYNGITVSTGIYNVDVIEEEYPDAIAELFAKIDAIESGGGSEIFLVRIEGYVDDDSGELHITDSQCDIEEIINQHNNDKYIVLRMLYHYDWFIYGYLLEMNDMGGLVTFYITDGGSLNHFIVNDKGNWRTIKVQNSGTVDLSGHVTKEELNKSIQSAILDSWAEVLTP